MNEVKRSQPRAGYFASRHASQSASALLLVLGLDVRVRTRARGKPCELPQCPRRGPAAVPLWQRPRHEILDTLALARKNYLTLVKANHPDLHGGDGSELAYLNGVWKRLQRVFKTRGYHIDD